MLDFKTGIGGNGYDIIHCVYYKNYNPMVKYTFSSKKLCF